MFLYKFISYFGAVWTLLPNIPEKQKENRHLLIPLCTLKVPNTNINIRLYYYGSRWPEQIYPKQTYAEKWGIQF